MYRKTTGASWFTVRRTVTGWNVEGGSITPGQPSGWKVALRAPLALAHASIRKDADLSATWSAAGSTVGSVLALYARCVLTIPDPEHRHRVILPGRIVQ